MSISIFTITHVPFTPPEDPIYIPLQVGHALHDDYGYQGDDTGDNISDKNPYYSELTGLYWIWKNYTDADYLGLCHYRRYFLNQGGTLMTESDYMHIMSEYDVIIAKPSLGEYDYRTVYARSHDIRNLDMTGEVIRRLYPDYYETFETVVADHHCYVGNLFAAPKAVFHAYCEWLFTIFFALEGQIDWSSYDDYHKRVFGFLSEQLLIVWIKYNNLSCYEAPYSLSQEKAETILLKENIKKYIANADLAGAYQCLNKTLEKRPDLLLKMSDFGQELKTIEHIINACRVEQEADLPTLLQFSRELDILIKHFRLLVQILENIKIGTVTEEELQYLIDCKVSYKGLVYIIQNFMPLAAQPLGILNQLAVIYANAGLNLVSLSFLEEALSIRETDKTTLSNIVAVLQNMGQIEMAEEYAQLLNAPSAKRIAVFTGSEIPILTYISEQYIAALEALGHTVFRYNTRHFEESFNALFAFQQHGLDAVIIFNNVGFQMLLDSGESLWDLWNVPCYNIIVDHPMYYFDTLDQAPSMGVVACADRYHTDYIKRFYPTVSKTIFLPTAGECLKPFEKLKPFKERSIDVLFIGGYKYDPSHPNDAFADQLTEYLMTHPSETFEAALEHCLQVSHRHLSNEELKECIQQYRFIDMNVAGFFRLEILRVLVNAGIPVTVYGNNFETTDLYHHPNFLYKGCCTTEEGIRLMEDSKIVLNQLAWFKAGASERIFEAMLQGSVAVTDDSAYLREHFEDSADIKFYSLSQLNALPDIVRSILTDYDLAETIRRNAYEKAFHQHTWLQRASILMDDLDRHTPIA